METLLAMAATNALLATLLALPAWLAGRAFPRRPALAHALWLLMLLKLVTPPVVSLDVAWGRSAQAVQAEPELAAPDAECCRLIASDAEPVDAPAASAPASPRWPAWLAGAWLTGTGVIWSLTGLRLRRFLRLLRELPPAPGGVQTEVRQLAARLGVRRAPLALFSPPGCGLPPLVFAFVGPVRLVLPADLWAALDAAQRRTLLLHELAHLRRRDHWVRWLELLVRGLYWWHPVAWWASARLRHAEELCCDAWVTWAEPQLAADYAAALVETLAFLSCPRPRLPGVSAASPVVDLQRRLVMILNVRTHRRLSLAAAAALMALGAALLPLAPTLAAPDEPKAVIRLDDANQLVGSLKSCQACHQAAQKPTKKSDDLHGEVVRLLDEVRARRAAVAEQTVKLKKSQDELNRAPSQFERAHAPKNPPILTPARKPEGKDRLDELEKKLDRLLGEVEALRKEHKTPKKGEPGLPRR